MNEQEEYLELTEVDFEEETNQTKIHDLIPEFKRLDKKLDIAIERIKRRKSKTS